VYLTDEGYQLIKKDVSSIEDIVGKELTILFLENIAGMKQEVLKAFLERYRQED
jgi:hypothetical protein